MRLGATTFVVLAITLWWLREGQEAAGANPLDLAVEATAASMEKVRSGMGSGTYRAYLQRSGEEKLRLLISAKVRVAFEGNKYRIQLDHQVPPAASKAETKRIAVFDGSAVFGAQFTRSGKEERCDTRIYGVNEVLLATGGFRWNPSRLPLEVMDIDALLKKLGRQGIRMTSLPGGGYVGRGELSKEIAVVFEVLPQFGFHVSALRFVYRADERTAPQQTWATWKQAKGIWYVDSLVWQLHGPDGVIVREELHYDTFDVNPPIPSDVFALNALEMPENTRILDVRTGSEAKSYRYTKSRESDAARLDSLVKQAEAMPARLGPGDLKPGVLQGASSLWLGVAVTALALMVAGGFWWWHKRCVEA